MSKKSTHPSIQFLFHIHNYHRRLVSSSSSSACPLSTIPMRPCVDFRNGWCCWGTIVIAGGVVDAILDTYLSGQGDSDNNNLASVVSTASPTLSPITMILPSTVAPTTSMSPTTTRMSTLPPTSTNDTNTATTTQPTTTNTAFQPTTAPDINTATLPPLQPPFR